MLKLLVHHFLPSVEIINLLLTSGQFVQSDDDAELTVEFIICISFSQLNGLEQCKHYLVR